MQKALKILAVLALVAGTAAYGFTATTGVGKVYVKIVQDSVSINLYADTVNWGAIPMNTTKICAGPDQRIGLSNNGASNIDLKLQITGCTTSWTAGTTPTDNGTDKYVLSGIFTVWNSTPVAGDFAANDVILTASAQTASTSAFAKDAEADETVKGYNVPFGSDRNLKLRLLTPTALTTQQGNEVRIDLTITAVAH